MASPGPAPEVVLPDGCICNGLRRLARDATGPDLWQLFIGSEGTLAVITAAVLRLLPRPRRTLTVLAVVASPGDAPHTSHRAAGSLRG